METVQHPVKDRGQQKARRNDIMIRPEKIAYVPAKIFPAVVFNSPAGPIPDNIIAAFTYASTSDMPSNFAYPATPTTKPIKVKANQSPITINIRLSTPE